MISEVDFYRVAKIFIEEHGETALEEALKRVQSFTDNKDDCGRYVWTKIAEAIRELQTAIAPLSSSLH